jgi:hypothetical protein
MKKLILLCSISICTCCCFAQTPGAGWVVIPVTEYGALRARAYPIEHDPDPAPVEATLTRVDYQLRLDGGLASGHANLTVDILRDGWVRVPIPQGMLVREARLGDKLVSLVPSSDKGGQLSAVLSGKGRAVLRLELAFPVAVTGGEQRLTLPTGGSGVTRAEISMQPRDVEVGVSGGYVSERSEAHWLAYARGNEPLTFVWRRKIEERKVELPLRMRGSLNQLFGLGEDVTSLNAEVDIEVVQGAAKQVKIAVPDSVTINQVPGATVADWDVKGGELIVNFLEPVERSAKFTITGETKLARDGAIAIPLLRLLDTERESGGVAVDVLGAGEITDTKPKGLEVADPAELGAAVASRQSPSLAAFRLRPNATDRSLDMTVVRYTQQALLTANIEEARYRVLMSGEGKTLVQARYAVRNNQRNFVRITLPAGAVVWSSSLAGRPVRPGKAADGSLLIPLVKARAGEDAPLFAVEILYSSPDAAWSQKGRAAFGMPALDLPVSRTGLMLYYSALFRVTPEPGAFRMQPYERPVSAVFGGDAALPASSPTGAADDKTKAANQPALQQLVDRYKERSDARRTAALSPVRVSFPTVGPSLYFVSELTGEGKAASVELNYQKEKKGDVK